MPGTNTLDILTGRVYQLKLDFIGIVNRNQQDGHQLRKKKHHGATRLESETEFFTNHPAYRNISWKKKIDPNTWR